MIVEEFKESGECPTNLSKCPTNAVGCPTKSVKCPTNPVKRPTNRKVSNQTLEVSNKRSEVSNKNGKASNQSREVFNNPGVVYTKGVGGVEMKSLIDKIKQSLAILSAAEKKVGEYIILHSELIPNMTTKELSKKIGVSEASVIRFCKSIGMGSFKSFKLALVKDLTLTEMNLTDFSILQKKDTPYDSFQKVIQVNKLAIESCTDSMDKKELLKAVDAIKDAKKIVFFGVGGSSTAALDAHYKFTRLGYHSITSLDFHYMLTVIPYLTKNDIFVAISTSGKTRDVLELAQFAQKKGAIVIAITNLDKSPLYRTADIRLCTPNVEQDFRIGSIPSRMTQLTVIDTLYMSIFHHVGEKVIKQYQEARSEMEKLRR